MQEKTVDKIKAMLDKFVPFHEFFERGKDWPKNHRDLCVSTCESVLVILNASGEYTTIHVNLLVSGPYGQTDGKWNRDAPKIVRAFVNSRKLKMREYDDFDEYFRSAERSDYKDAQLKALKISARDLGYTLTKKTNYE